MKKFALVFLFLFAPVAYSATENETTKPKFQVPNNPFERLGKEAKFNCKDVGEDSCFSRFIAMSACTFAYGIAKSDKTVKESLDIARRYKEKPNPDRSYIDALKQKNYYRDI